MKKNAIGHMMLPKESAASWLRRSHLLPKLLCLLSAIVIWLVLVNLLPTEPHDTKQPSTVQLQVVATDPLDI